MLFDLLNNEVTCKILRSAQSDLIRWFTFKYYQRTEKAMAPHSSTLAWKIPWTEEPGGLQSMGLLWVGHNWATSLSLFTFMHWRRKWQPTPVFLPGKSQGCGSLVGCHLWSCRVGHDWSDLAAAAAAWTSFVFSIWLSGMWKVLINVCWKHP